MSATVSYSKQKGRSFAVIDDGNWRGIIAPKPMLSAKRLSMLIEDLEAQSSGFKKKIEKSRESGKVPLKKIEQDLEEDTRKIE